LSTGRTDLSLRATSRNVHLTSASRKGNTSETLGPSAVLDAFCPSARANFWGGFGYTAAMTIDARLLAQDEALCAVGPRIKVLSRLSWPEHVVEEFLADWRRGQPTLPNVEYPRDDYFDVAQDALIHIQNKTQGVDDPLYRYVHDTADSYAHAAELLNAAGTPRFLEISRDLYGDPYDRVPGTRLTHFETAAQLLDVTDSLRAASAHEEDLVCLTAESVRDEIQHRTDPFFGEHKLEIVVDANLASKAAASAQRIRIRGRTSFSSADIEQLIEHEAFIHSATSINGRLQRLRCFSLAAPRTTPTQEGLATLAELITGSMDISRLRRLALRIGGVKRAIEGADFIDVFRYFLDYGQTEDESARSAMRVFRGGDPRGRVAFTKDVVYLHGLIGVHTFLRRAISDGRVELIPRLFAGRLTLGDVIRLGPAFDSGDLTPGRYIAPWASDPRRLAAYLAFSLVLNRINIGNVQLESLLER
jgi:uncharacterized protein (TIGR02421 family)